MPELKIDLTLEQLASYRQFEFTVTALSEENAKQLLLELIRQNMFKDNVIKSLLKP